LVIKIIPRGRPREKIKEVGVINLVNGDRKTWFKKGEERKRVLIKEKGGTADIKAIAESIRENFNQECLEKRMPIIETIPRK